MIKSLVCIGLLTLAGCGERVIYESPPKLPAIDPEIKAACPPLPLLEDTSIATIATQDANAAYDYARCQAKQKALVELYDSARLARDEYNKKLEDQTKKK